MASRSLIFGAFCVAASLAVACGSDDDSALSPSGGASGTGHSAGAAGRTGGAGTAGAAGKSGGVGGGMPGGGSDNTAGEAGEGGAGPVETCTHFAPFVHGLISDSTTNKAAPTPVNGIVFCDDPETPAAFQDLF